MGWWCLPIRPPFGGIKTTYIKLRWIKQKKMKINLRKVNSGINTGVNFRYLQKEINYDITEGNVDIIFAETFEEYQILTLVIELENFDTNDNEFELIQSIIPNASEDQFVSLGDTELGGDITTLIGFSESFASSNQYGFTFRVGSATQGIIKNIYVLAKSLN